jgi:hypothetical protein
MTACGNGGDVVYTTKNKTATLAACNGDSDLAGSKETGVSLSEIYELIDMN